MLEIVKVGTLESISLLLHLVDEPGEAECLVQGHTAGCKSALLSLSPHPSSCSLSVTAIPKPFVLLTHELSEVTEDPQDLVYMCRVYRYGPLLKIKAEKL